MFILHGLNIPQPLFQFFTVSQERVYFYQFPKRIERESHLWLITSESLFADACYFLLCALLLPAIVTKVSTGASPLSDGGIKIHFLMLKTDLDLHP